MPTPNEEGQSLQQAMETFRRRNSIQYDVFVSYSTKDEAKARQLVHELAAAGLKYFFAPNDIDRWLYDENTDQFAQPLQDALIRSCQTVALVSNVYLDSAWCELELMGAFNFVKDNGGRGLHIVLLEDVGERLIGQLYAFVYQGTDHDLAQHIKEEQEQLKLRLGDDLGNKPPVPFPDLPIRKFYEPPQSSPRAPWGFDARTPRGYPGAPPYEVYQELVREYMVQMNKLGGPPDPIIRDRGYVLKLEIPNLPEKYAFMNKRAFDDATDLLREGVSPTPWRASLRDIWEDAQSALHKQGDDPDIQLRLGMVSIWEGRLPQALEFFKRAVEMEQPPAPASLAYLAATYYQMKDYQKAAELLDPLKDGGNYLVNKVMSIALARLGRMDAAHQCRDVVLKISPDFSLTRERVDTWFVNNRDLDHWMEGFGLAGYE